MDKEAYDGLLIAVTMAATKKVKAGLRELAKGEYQCHPPGLLELGIVLDAIDMVANDVINAILANQDETFAKDIRLNHAAAGFAVIANNAADEGITAFALENFEALKERA